MRTWVIVRSNRRRQAGRILPSLHHSVAVAKTKADTGYDWTGSCKVFVVSKRLDLEEHMGLSVCRCGGGCPIFGREAEQVGSTS
jgi:hypothetical protein